jgi:hypothetical protein
MFLSGHEAVWIWPKKDVCAELSPLELPIRRFSWKMRDETKDITHLPILTPRPSNLGLDARAASYSRRSANERFTFTHPLRRYKRGTGTIINRINYGDLNIHNSPSDQEVFFIDPVCSAPPFRFYM